METRIINTEFKYKIPDSNLIVDVSDHIYKYLMIASLSEGSNGISGLDCLITNKPIFLCASVKLERLYNPDFFDYDDMTEEEIENEDNLI